MLFKFDLCQAICASMLLCFCVDSEKQTVSLLWLNAAETWIDISSNTADKVLFELLFVIEELKLKCTH